VKALSLGATIWIWATLIYAAFIFAATAVALFCAWV
jgi:hypothetical protein